MDKQADETQNPAKHMHHETKCNLLDMLDTPLRMSHEEERVNGA